jgi:hypothetical protein
MKNGNRKTRKIGKNGKSMKTRKNKSVKKYKLYKKKYSKKYSLGKGPNDTCCMCNKKINSNDFLIPSKCLAQNGRKNAHKICNKCWWSKFAIEGANHKCPGCEKEPKIVRPKINNEVINLVSTSD